MGIRGDKLLYTMSSIYDSETEPMDSSAVWTYPIEDHHSDNRTWYVIVNEDNLKSPAPR